MDLLRQAAQRALEVLVHYSGDDGIYHYAGLMDAITTLRAALAQPEQEPVAWRFEARHIDSAWGAAVSLKHPGPGGVYMRNVVPLYTAPPQRQPLTDQEAMVLWADVYEPGHHIWILAERFARAIEAAHGIGGEE